MHQLLGVVGDGRAPGRRAPRHRRCHCPTPPVAADDQALQAGLVVQHLEDRHRGHRGAVRVGDDALRRVLQRFRVHLADDEGDLGVLAPRRRVVDDDRTGRGEARGLCPGQRRTGREQRDVDALQILIGRRGDVLDHDLLAAERQLLPAERAEAKNRTLSAGKFRSSSRVRMTMPTCPVAPTTAMVVIRITVPFLRVRRPLPRRRGRKLRGWRARRRPDRCP